jgi:DNA polymerase-3 subunit delta'
LKILEEPPSKTVLILTTSQPGAFLPTIRSRCRMVQMEPLSDNTVSTLLDKFSPGIGGEEKMALIRLADGSIGRAMHYHADGGVALHKDLLKAAATLPDLDTVLVHDLAEKIGRFGAEQSFEIAREIMTGWCARQARAQARGEQAAGALDKIAGLYPPRHFFDTWEKMSQLFHQTEVYNLDKRQAILGAFLMLQKPEYQGLNI